MREELARLVTPIIRCTLDLRESWIRGIGPSHDAGRFQLREHFQALVQSVQLPKATEAPNGVRYQGVAYPLACWIDELFTRTPQIAASWNEQKFEAEYFGTNDRAWLFWKQAELAAKFNSDDDLEVFYICAGLGFRGERIEEPHLYRAWASTTRDRLLSTRKPSWVPPPSLDPPSAVPQLTGRSRAKRMVRNAGIYLLIATPVIAWFILQNFSR